MTLLQRLICNQELGDLRIGMTRAETDVALGNVCEILRSGKRRSTRFYGHPRNILPGGPTIFPIMVGFYGEHISHFCIYFGLPEDPIAPKVYAELMQECKGSASVDEWAAILTELEITYKTDTLSSTEGLLAWKLNTNVQIYFRGTPFSINSIEVGP